MNTIEFGQNSFGTIYGTVRDYNTIGEDIGPKNIDGYGIFFVVRENWNSVSRRLITKTIGTGITITDASNGKFLVTLQATNLVFSPAEYVYTCWVNPSGTTLTSELKSIGSGIFKIRETAYYGIN